MAGGYPGTAWLRSINGLSAGKVRPDTQRLVSPIGEGSTAASQGLAAGTSRILRRARFYRVSGRDYPAEHPGTRIGCQTAALRPIYPEMRCVLRTLCIAFRPRLEESKHRGHVGRNPEEEIQHAF